MSDTAASGSEVPDEMQGSARIEYELHDWPIEARQMMRQLLLGAGVAHVWQGGGLVVAEAAEEIVDELVDQVEAATSETLLDSDAQHVAFDVADWDDELVGQLTSRLDSEDVPWAFTAAGELVVTANDAEQVEAIVEAIEFPDALEPDQELSSDEDHQSVEIDPDEVLGGLFVASDRLARNAADSNGVLQIVQLNETLAEARMPFGYEPKVWEEIRSRTATLAAQLEADDGGDMSDDQLEEAAGDLRNLLRSWV